jgi:hypothetical protein
LYHESAERDDNVDRDGDVRRHRRVIHAKQVEPRKDAAQHGASDVAAVKEAEPRDALGRGFHPSRDGRQRRTHQQRRRQQTHAGDQAAKQQPGHARSRPRRVDVADQRHADQREQSDEPDAQLETRIHAQRMLTRRHEVRQREAAQTHAAHECAEEYSQRNRRGSDHQLQQLEPDDFVDEGRAPAADEQQQERRKNASRRHGLPRGRIT